MENQIKVTVEYREDFAWLSLSSAEEKIAVLTKERMDSLEACIEDISNKQNLKALIISSYARNGFCAGADINVIDSVKDQSFGENLAKRGQDIFTKIEKLPLKKVAIIKGPCVGGGCELVLACDHRILLNTEDTKIGLPETKLGILPGFGGTQRLPRLIGIPQALEIILKGKVLRAKQAYSIGLADLLVEVNPDKNYLEQITATEDKVKSLLIENKLQQKSNISLLDKFLTNTFVGRALVKAQATKSLNKETRGNYPAPFKALECVLYGFSKGKEKGYLKEAKDLGYLITTDVCKSLVHIFKITEGATKLAKAAYTDIANLKVMIIGSGVMGAGIATNFLIKAHQVYLIDTSEDALKKAKGFIEKNLEKRRDISNDKRSEILQLLVCKTNYEDLNPDIGLVIEAIVEDLEVKRKLFQTLAEKLPPETIFASNTSSLSLAKISENLPNPERFIGLHFFNPADKMPLVEVIRINSTNEKTLLQSTAIVGRLAKYPIVVEDVPGFLVNRILTPYLNEAVYLLADGIPISRIDKAAVKFGMPMGPLRLLDEVGLDVAAKVAKVIEEGYGERMKALNLAEKLLTVGRKGKKSGKGFYVYQDKKEVLDPHLANLLNLPAEPKYLISDEEIGNRLMLPMINEAIRCLDEGVAGLTGPESAAQIDLGSVMGTGFAPFRGGIIFYAEKLGVRKIKDKLSELHAKLGIRFEPAAGLQKRIQENKGFFTI